jgi:hypothetical protein
VELLESRELPAVAVGVDAAADRHAISSLIYGLAFADSAALGDLNVPYNRSGGNAETRYNWQLNASNRGADWYFESIADGGATPGETTGVRVCDLNRPQAPSGFDLPGSTRTIPLPYDPTYATDKLPQRQLRAARTGQLDDWGSRIVTRQLTALTRAAGEELDPTTRISYGGGHQPGGQQATMSAQRVIDGILVKAGLYHLADITAKSVSLYAASAAAARGDRQTALTLTGETEHRTRRLLTTDLPRPTSPRPTAPRFRRAA